MTAQRYLLTCQSLGQRDGVEGSEGKKSKRLACAGELAQSVYACTRK